MLNKYNSVFILGAGASKPYNLPLGDELYHNIWKYFANNVNHYYNKVLNSTNPTHKKIIELAYLFKQDLSRVFGISIDKFLNINKQKYSEIGKIAIISEILKSENTSNMPSVSNNLDGDWIKYLWSFMIKDLDSIESLKKFNSYNNLSVITFNYDRLFEHILFENLYGLLINNNCSRLDVARIVQQIPIIHIYGKIGYLPWEKNIEQEKNIYSKENKIVSYGYTGKASPIVIGNEISNLVEIIYDQRENNPEILNAHELIKNSDRIYFLGFGFDQMNIDILKLNSLLKYKKIFVTTFKKTQNEVKQIKKSLGLDSDARNFTDIDNLGLLRNYLE